MDEVLHIGFDDTDSPRKGCTTYVAALLVELLMKLGASFIDYPNLIRLNPNVPWKTRGNGALYLRIKVDAKKLDKVKEVVIKTLEKHSDFSASGTDPGVVFYTGNVTPDVSAFSKRALQDIVKMSEALKIIKTNSAEAIGFKKGRGIIGALAAIGNRLLGDHTYELITYRRLENRATPRKLDSASVAKMDQQTKPLTFNNIDPENGRIIITPRGPDPILYGVRGEAPEILEKARRILKAGEEIERWVIFRTNHGTDAHLKPVKMINQIRPYCPTISRGIVAKMPWMIPGRHVFFTLKDVSGQVDCAAYEPTGKFRNVVRQLVQGDLVEVYGGVRPATPAHPQTINLEKIRVLKLASKVAYQNPLCPKCDKRMKSMGTRKGFRCDKCGFRSVEAKKVCLELPRNLNEGLYIPPPSAHRHLTKPHQRYGKERMGLPSKLFEPWHKP
jgi:tRNA(Ile2)-agmatinylcytidine synthase